MKKICSMVLALLVIFGSLPVMAADANVVETFTASFLSKQGTDGWFACEFDGANYSELVWDSTKNRWKSPTDTFPIIQVADMVPSNTKDVGFVFICPRKGMIRLNGTVKMAYGIGTVYASISKGKKELWKSAKITEAKSYALTDIPVKEGEVLKFKVNCENTNANDYTLWYPTVEYLNEEYVAEADGFLYFQCDKNGNRKELKLDQATEGYTAEDGIAFMNSEKVFPSEEYSLIRQYTVESEGRHRIYADFRSTDKRSGGKVVTVFKNGEEIWKQLIPKGEASCVDVRAYCKAGDVIDIEVGANDYTGFNMTEWECDVTKFVDTLFCYGTTSAGYSNVEVSKFTLGSLVKSQTGNGTRYYSIRRDKEYPMTYNSSAGRWTSTADDYGYVSSESAMPGKGATTCIDYTVKEAGTLRISGDLNVSEGGDGVLSKIYKNGKMIWSSRVGEERSVRWNEPYDVSYFSNYINVTTEVEVGDVLTFSFDKWRTIRSDTVTIDTIEFMYINGNVLSDTTKWKLNNSIVVNTKDNSVRANGEKVNASVIISNGVTYLQADTAAQIFGQSTENVAETVNGNLYVPIRKYAESCGKNVLWTDGGLVIIYSGIPVLFGYSELSEIGIAMKGGVLFD